MAGAVCHQFDAGMPVVHVFVEARGHRRVGVHPDEHRDQLTTGGQQQIDQAGGRGTLSGPTTRTSSPAMPRPSPVHKCRPRSGPARWRRAPNRAAPRPRPAPSCIRRRRPAYQVVDGKRREALHHRPRRHRHHVDAPADARGAARDQFLGRDVPVGQHHHLGGTGVDQGPQQLTGADPWPGSADSGSGRSTSAPSRPKSSSAPSPSTTASTAFPAPAPRGRAAGPGVEGRDLDPAQRPHRQSGLDGRAGVVGVRAPNGDRCRRRPIGPPRRRWPPSRPVVPTRRATRPARPRRHRRAGTSPRIAAAVPARRIAVPAGGPQARTRGGAGHGR